MGHVPTPRAPLFAIARPEILLRGVFAPAADHVKERLLAGDPDWEEFKRRWAEEFGEP